MTRERPALWKNAISRLFSVSTWFTNVPVLDETILKPRSRWEIVQDDVKMHTDNIFKTEGLYIQTTCQYTNTKDLLDQLEGNYIDFVTSIDLALKYFNTPNLAEGFGEVLTIILTSLFNENIDPEVKYRTLRLVLQNILLENKHLDERTDADPCC